MKDLLRIIYYVAECSFCCYNAILCSYKMINRIIDKIMCRIINKMRDKVGDNIRMRKEMMGIKTNKNNKIYY